jgi:hypothetical protein
MSDLIRLKYFTSLPEAELACSILHQAGIACLLQKDGIPGATGWFQGAELLVYADDRTKAIEALRPAID